MKQTERDLAFLQSTHQVSKMMGLSDAEIIKVAKTNGDIDPDAMDQYLNQYEGRNDE